MKFFLRSYVRMEDPLYAGERRWWVAYRLTAAGQEWMDYVSVESFSEARRVLSDLLNHKWFPDLTRYVK